MSEKTNGSMGNICFAVSLSVMLLGLAGTLSLHNVVYWFATEYTVLSAVFTVLAALVAVSFKWPILFKRLLAPLLVAGVFGVLVCFWYEIFTSRADGLFIIPVWPALGVCVGAAMLAFCSAYRTPEPPKNAFDRVFFLVTSSVAWAAVAFFAIFMINSVAVMDAAIKASKSEAKPATLEQTSAVDTDKNDCRLDQSLSTITCAKPEKQ
ncbi:hypothetical protein G6L37_00660 [Agrobacterium rubi]|nr:hypothetical protein [Agrobacterium rubi]NTF23901.1 hypothetical protein [Agrobacterium rubi]